MQATSRSRHLSQAEYLLFQNRNAEKSANNKIIISTPSGKQPYPEERKQAQLELCCIGLLLEPKNRNGSKVTESRPKKYHCFCLFS